MSFVSIAQEADTSAPELSQFYLNPNAIRLSDGNQDIKLSLRFEDDSSISLSALSLQHLSSSSEISLIQNGDFVTSDTKHLAELNASFTSSTNSGLWYVSSLVVEDNEGNQNSQYSSIESLIAEGFNPFISAIPDTSTNTFDAAASVNSGFSSIGNEQLTSVNILVEDAVEYDIWVVPKGDTSITDVSFDGAISLAESCVNHDTYFLCTITASNSNSEFTMEVTSSADDITDFSYTTLVQVNSAGFESDWLDNIATYPFVDTDTDGSADEQDLDDDDDGVDDVDDLFPLNDDEDSDADADGIGDNADEDDDNDGVSDDQDDFPFDPLENNDNDDDGLGDNADVDDDNDGVLDSSDAFPFDDSESLDTDGDGIGNNEDNDDDNDGGIDANDAFPLDPSETIDSDGDGVGNNADLDDDNDGTPDESDPFPRDDTEDTDTDEDGIGNNADPDDDNDGVLDEDDEFPLDAGDSEDNDQDGLGNNADPDDDNDGVEDEDDAFPFNASEFLDSDGDGIGDNADPDDDNDGLDDLYDDFPKDASEVNDFDGDGVGNNADTDDDNDGVLDVVDAFPFAVSEWLDTDEDGIGNNADPDNDNDGVDDEFDDFENDASETTDTDSDGIGNNSDTDDDGDGTDDINDDFPLDASEDTDTDGDGVGNNSDEDDDGDGVLDTDDLFPLDASETADNDLDGVGNNADLDDDNDEVLDADDAFPFDATESNDNDADSIGDNADADDDNDGVLDADDLFPFDSSEWEDNDLDNIGNNADTDDDNDGVLDTLDAFPFDASETLDNDGDGVGNNADTDDDNDGVLDDVDAFPFSDAESIDTDGDGIGNNADSDDDNDGIVDENDSQPLNATIGDIIAPTIEELDDFSVEAVGVLTDITLTEPRVSDDNLNPAVLTNNYDGPLPLGVHEIVWTAEDFAGNTTQFIQTVTVVDTTAPEFPVIATIDIDARGILTDVSQDVLINAFDLVDAQVLATIVSENHLKSGEKSVIVQAEDASGNAAIAEVFLNIKPIIVSKDSGIAAPGSSIDLPIGLSGEAANYPVLLPYQVVGPVTGETNGVTQINEGQHATISIDIAATASLGQQVFVSFSEPSNASLGDTELVTIDIDNNNYAPTADIKLYQDSNVVASAYQNEGLASLQANISDVNVDDTYAFTWSVFSTASLAANGIENAPSVTNLALDNNASSFEFDPQELASGNYIAVLEIVETNTFERYGVELEFAFAVNSGSADFSSEIDSDFDGISNELEGVIDEDLDSIADYLDNEENQSLLPTGASEQSLTTLHGYRLSLGDIAKRANALSANSALISYGDIALYGGADGSSTSLAADIHYEAVQEIQNFNIEGLEYSGESVAVVVPVNTGTFIPEDAVYRKFNSEEGWFSFVENANNAILSASFDNDENCPNPDSANYTSGLNAGDTCILLIIQDGGPNDADLSANGIIKDPGVLALQLPNSSPIINVNQELSVVEGELVRIDASLSTDAEGDTLVYRWTQISGSRISIGENSLPLLSFNAPLVNENESLLFVLEVSDGSDTSSVNIRVNVLNQNTAPTVEIDYADSVVDEGESFSLYANVNDLDGDFISYQWQQVSGPSVDLSSLNSARVDFTAPAVEANRALIFSVTVSDGIKEVSTSVTITVINQSDDESGDSGGDASDSSGGSLHIFWLLSLGAILLFRAQAYTRHHSKHIT